MQAAKIIVVPEGNPCAGAIVWWRLSGETDVTRLEAQWVANGLDPKNMPELPSTERALRRALRQVEGKRLLCRPVTQGTWAFVQEYVDSGQSVSYTSLFHVKLTAEGALDVELLCTDAATLALTAQVAAEFEVAKAQLSQQDVSAWLCKFMGDVQAVSLRDTGGIYFIPQPLTDTWRKVVAAFEACSSHQLFEVPAMRSDEAVRAILDAVNREAEQEAAGMESDITEKELGKRALQTRTDRCQGLLEKLGQYEELLGAKMDDLRVRLDQLKINLAVAALRADEEAE